MSGNICWRQKSILGAYDVGKRKRIAQVAVSVIYCLLSSGIIFGYAALKPVLIEEGVYRELCTEDEIRAGETLCYEQEIRLNLMFTASVVVTNVCALPVGTILDAYGPRFTINIGGILIALGALLFVFASHFPYDAYLCGYILLSMGGPLVFIPSFHLSNTFPRHSGLILSLLTGAFDCSSALFLLFRLIHGPNFTLRDLFLVYLVVPGFILSSQLLLMPAQSYSTVGELLKYAEEIHDSFGDGGGPGSEGHVGDQSSRYQEIARNIEGLINGNENVRSRDTGENVNPTIPDNSAQRNEQSWQVTGAAKPTESFWGVMHTAPALKQIRSPWFILITLFTIVQMVRVNYFISTLRLQYEYLLSSPALAQNLNHIFDFFLPLGGLIAVPFIGLILDSATMTTILFILVSSATVIGILGCIPHSLTAGYANISLFVLYRPYFYTVISDYAAKVFGFQTFGKVYGLIICLAGIGNFIQSPLDMLTLKQFNKDPIPVNAGLTVTAFVVGAMLVVFVWRRSSISGNADMERSQGITGGSGDPDTYAADNDYETDQLIRSPGRLNDSMVYGAIP